MSVPYTPCDIYSCADDWWVEPLPYLSLELENEVFDQNAPVPQNEMVAQNELVSQNEKVPQIELVSHEFSFLDEKRQRRMLSVMAKLKLSKFTMAKHLSIIRHCVG